HVRRGPSPPPCPLWVNLGHRRCLINVRIATESGRAANNDGWPRSAMRRPEQVQQLVLAKCACSMTSSARPSNGRNGYFASSTRVPVPTHHVPLSTVMKRSLG